MNLQSMIDNLLDEPLSEVMKKLAQTREARDSRILGYETTIEVHLLSAESWIRTMRERIRRGDEHWRIETAVDSCCERLGAAEIAYDLLLKEKS